jgi:hypothetical protein
MSMLLRSLFAGAAAFLAAAAFAQQSERPGPTLIQPADGAVVDREVVVRIGFAGQGPHGPAEGTGIAFDGAPARFARQDGPAGPPRGPSDGTGVSANGERNPRGPHFAMLIDLPAPLPGTPFHADARHVAFPIGIPQMTLTLAPGRHQLTLVRLDDEGAVARRGNGGEPTTITVKN